jgi:hypothetical protein
LLVQEGSVISSSVCALSLATGVHLRVGLGSVANTKDVVNVDIGGKGTELIVEALADVGGVHGLATVVTVVLGHLVVESSVVKGVPVSHFDVGGSAIELVVGNTIADHETLEVGLEDISGLSICSVVLVNVVGEIGNVDSGVGLTRDVELVLAELGEFVKEGKDSGQVVSSGLIVGVVIALLETLALGEADSSGGLNVEHVGLLVPGVIVNSPEVGATVNLVGTVFLGEAEHGRAAGTTIEPNDDGVGGGFVLGLDEHVMEGLGSVNVEVAGVDGVSVEDGEIGHGEDTISFIGSEGNCGDSSDDKGFVTHLLLYTTHNPYSLYGIKLLINNLT